MTSNGVCRRCGAKISGDATREVCPACLLEIGESTEILNNFGDFEIARREDGSLWELGRGGMGVTYRARDNVLHRSVALKVIQVPFGAGDSEVMRERFLREARAAAALRHPNVAAVYHFGTVPEPDLCYYAMELVEGETLEARVRREGPLKVAQVLEIAAQVSRALIAAAHQGLIHRDLKLGNIMLTRDEDSSAGFDVKVIDFGLAKVTAESFGETDLTHGGFVGTPSYASPEQFAGGRVDARSDIYSLGASLWFALTGRLPCAGNKVEEIRRCQMEAPLPVQQLVMRKVPAAVIELLRNMLAVDPDERPASARELMEAIEECRLKLTGGNETTRRSLFAELQRRNVYKVAIAYAVIAWLLMQITTQVFPFLEIPNWAIRLVIMLLVLGFPIALVIAWAFELTPEGLKRTEVADREPAKPSRNQAWVYVVVIAAALSVCLFFIGRYNAPNQHPTSGLPEKSVAVLPFENLSADPENAFFTDGVQDEILNDLAKIADLKVISRTSVMQYKSGVKRNVREIANALGVAHIVEGSVQRATNHVRVSAQLIDAKTDTHLWAERYDRPLDDVFAIQSEIAKAIAGQLQAKLSPAEKIAIEQPPTTNLVAYDRYVRAEKLWAFPTTRLPQDMREIIRLLEQAVAHDPTFLIAYCELARAHAYVYHLGVDHTPARVVLAETARDAALRLGPDRGEPHLAATWVAYWCYRDYETALTEVGIARRRLPNNESVFSLPAYIARRQGHWEQCIGDLRRAIELDPRNVWLLTGVAQTYQSQRRFSDAAAVWDRVLAVAPGDPSTRLWRGVIELESRADTQPAQEAIRAVVHDDPNAVDAIAEQWLYVAFCRREAAEMTSALASLPPEGIIPWNVRMPRSFFEGLAARVRNELADAARAFTAARVEMEKIVREQPDYAQALCVLGMIDAALGRKEDALREGRRATELLPVTKDAWAGAAVLTNLAIIYAWVGEKDLAINQLEEAMQIPGPVSYGQLRLHPFWDPLRGDPRFEKLVEEVKKPVALESLRPLPTGIAVLPFENLSADPENAFFADGVQDEILNNLAKIAELKVISRTSVMQYKSGAQRNLRQIANELGVAHVVEGSVQRAANRVRVSAQLIDAKTDTHLWAERYDRSLDDVFAIQSDIAQAIVGALRVKLSPSQATALAAAPTRDAEAYDLFLKGEYQERQAESTENVEFFDRAETFYREALARDPNFALAYARLAYSRLNRHWFSNRLNSAQLEEVRSNIERALAIAPNLSEAYLALGVFHYWGHRDYDPALKALDRAIELQPSNFDSRTFRAAIYRRRGEWRPSLAEFERALELNPRDSLGPTELGNTWLPLRRWSEAERALTRALALDPHNINAAHHLALTYVGSTGDTRRARRAWEGVPDAKGQVSPYGILISQMIREDVSVDVLERRFGDALKAWDLRPTDTAEGRLRQLKARIGIQVLAGQKAAAKPQCEEARALLEAELAKRRPEDRTSVSELAWIYVCLGRNADALRVAQEAAESTPLEKDTLLGTYFLLGLAQIEAHTGQSEEAIKLLRQLLTIPAGEYVSVARLKIDPVWDPIRNDPGFQKLLSEPEPETIYK